MGPKFHSKNYLNDLQVYVQPSFQYNWSSCFLILFLCAHLVLERTKKDRPPVSVTVSFSLLSKIMRHISKYHRLYDGNTLKRLTGKFIKTMSEKSPFCHHK